MSSDSNLESSIVTFIIPTVCRNTLERSINCLLKQTSSFWRCIVVFDGCQPIHFDDDRIEYIHLPEKQLNASHVRNIGIQHAKTEWIAFLDDDDVIDINCVKLLKEKYCDYDFVIFKMQYDNICEVLPKHRRILSANVGISFAYKRKFDTVKFRCLNELNIVSGEDFFFLADLEKKTSNWTVSDEILYYIRFDGNTEIAQYISQNKLLNVWFLKYDSDGNLIFRWGEYSLQGVEYVLKQNQNYFDWIQQNDFTDDEKTIVKKIYDSITSV